MDPYKLKNYQLVQCIVGYFASSDLCRKIINGAASLSSYEYSAGTKMRPMSLWCFFLSNGTALWGQRYSWIQCRDDKKESVELSRIYLWRQSFKYNAGTEEVYVTMTILWNCTVKAEIWIQISSKWCLCAPPSSFSSVVFKTVPVFWLMMALYPPVKEDCLALPLSTPLFSRQLMVRCPWLCALR